MTSVDVAAVTDVGRARDHNEDAVHAASPLFAVADGVGGSPSGEVASQMAIDELVSALADRPETATAEETARLLEGAIVRANTRVFGSANGGGVDRDGMATTMTAAIICADGRVAIGHVGDSRAYRIPAGDGPADQLTADHSMVAELVRSGRLDAEVAQSHPQRNVVTRALGAEPDVTVDTRVAGLGSGDTLLLCSDGLTDRVDDREIATIVRDAGRLDDAARALVDLANERGGTDNISAVLVRPRSPAAHAGTAADVIDATGEISLESFRQPTRRERRQAARAQRGAADAPSHRWRSVVIAASAAIAAAGVGAIAWSQSYFLTSRSDGTIGIDQGFPTLSLSHPYRSTDVQAETLTSVQRERLDEGTLRSKENAEKALDELVRDTPAPPAGAGLE